MGVWALEILFILFKAAVLALWVSLAFNFYQQRMYYDAIFYALLFIGFTILFK